MLFVIAVGNGKMFSISKNVDNNSSMDCSEYADITQGIVMLTGISFEESLTAWINAYDACIGYQIENLVEVEEEEEIIPEPWEN